MPRLKAYSEQYARTDFIKAIKKAQVDADIANTKQLAELVNIPYTTLWRRLQDPDTLTVGQLKAIIKTISLPPEAVLSFLGYK